MSPSGKWKWPRFWEPEESAGRAWDALSDTFVDAPRFPAEAAILQDMRGRLGVLFRGLGGDPGVAIKAGADRVSAHRRSWRRRLAKAEEKAATARFDGVELLLPEAIDALPTRALNADLYIWLAALASIGALCEAPPVDPLQADVALLARARAEADEATRRFPGLRPLRNSLYAAALAVRPRLAAPPLETALEDWVRAELAGATDPSGDDPLSRALGGDPAARDRLAAPAKYRRVRLAPVWIDRAPPPGAGPPRTANADEAPGGGSGEGAEKKKSAERRAGDQANRRDNLILHRFESILSFADFLNLNRAVDDDEESSAKRAADDAEKLGVVDQRRRPKTRLKLDLDLAPQDAAKEEIADKFAYPEWDWKTKRLEPNRTRILETPAPPGPHGLLRDAKARRRIEAVRRRFEALRPKRRMLSRQLEGSELDLDEVVRAFVDRRAQGHGGERLYRDARNEERDLAVAVLFDASRSTESTVHGQSVIAIGREALEALARGLDACGDQVALYAFSSLRRDRVFVDVCKTFDEPFGPLVDARVAALKPGFYTRLGAAIRHVSFRLAERPNARKLLLLITDGKPNDLDHYEGRYGIEDTRHAVQEARRRGQAVFAIAIDSQARAHLPHLFGRSGYALAPASDRLLQALPVIYQHILA